MGDNCFNQMDSDCVNREDTIPRTYRCRSIARILHVLARSSSSEPTTEVSFRDKNCGPCPRSVKLLTAAN